MPERIPSNWLRELPDARVAEVLQTLVNRPHVRIERIVSLGQASPEGFWYDQEWHEFVLLLAGAARLRFEDAAEPVVLRPGDWLSIAAHRRHRVEWTDSLRPTVWLAVHYQ